MINEGDIKAQYERASAMGVVVKTDYVHPPIPDRSMDWSAVTDNYDGAEDCHDPIGRGATEAEAIADLLDQIEDAC